MALAWTDQSKDKCVRSQAITMAYDSDVFRNKDTHSTIRSKHKSRKNSIFNFKHSLLFIFLFFKNFPVGLLWLLAELTCVTLTSKSAVTLRDQNPPTLMSNRASGLVFADLKSTLSLSSGWRCGSDSTFLQTLLITDVNSSRIPSCVRHKASAAVLLRVVIYSGY